MNYAKNSLFHFLYRNFYTSAVCQKPRAGRYKVTRYRNRPLTYEMAMKPHDIAHRKSWNSWNTTSLYEGLREPEIVIDDMFIRKFMEGTFHNSFASEIIIKRQFNITRIAGIIEGNLSPVKIYFLIGYTEQLLSYWLKGPVKLELQVVKDKKDTVYKYI